MRRNTGVPRTYLKLAAAVLASGLAVAACGTVKMGAAAIVGNQRISSNQLASEVSSYNAAFSSYHGKIQQQFSASQTPQQVLGWLVSFQVGDRMAERYGITVSPAQQQQALTSITNAIRAQDPGATLGELAAAIGLAPDMVSNFGRFEAIQNAVTTRLDGGKAPATDSAAAQQLNTAFAASQCRAAKSLAIQVSPQFGELDYSLNQYAAYSVVPATSTLSRSQSSPSPSSSPTSPPQLTPPC
jgi:folylpolyglutamate synthase/dihydropteroate synthase